MNKTCLILSLILILSLYPAFSTSVVKLNLSEMTSKADYIGKGIVEKTYSQWENNNTKIYTYTSININKNYKGNNKKAVIKTLGGVVGDIGMRVPGQAIFNEKEEVLLFLEEENDAIAKVSKNLGLSDYEAQTTSEYKIVGFSQGKFSIKDENEEKIVYNDEIFELALVAGDGIKKSEFKAMPLEDFEKQIHSGIKHQEEQGIFQHIKEFILKIFSFLR